MMETTSPPRPTFSVVIPSRDRPEALRRAVESVLASEREDFELVVVDQSRRPMPTLAEVDPRRVRYRHARSVGVAAARNEGVVVARGEILVHTDDDCRAPSRWLHDVARVFRAHPDADVVFGSVEAAADRADHFVPAYRVRREAWARRLSQKCNVEGIGACFAYRREVWEAVGGFDESFGAGGVLHSAEEVDFTLRALARGFVALETPAIGVVHHGHRHVTTREDLLRGHLFGIGAAFAKQVRRSPVAFTPVLVRFGARWAFAEPRVSFGEVPPRWPRLDSYLRGFWKGWNLPLDERDRFGALGG